MSKILKNKIFENFKQKNSQYGCEDVLPVDFVSLMDMYEDNYIKIRKLIPGLQQIKESAISKSTGHLDLHL